MQDLEGNLQWHPAFYAGLQIELEQEKEKLSFDFPQKLLQYLKEVEHFTIREIEQGICYVDGDRFPIQLIIIPKLSKQENLWLKNLTNHLKHVSDAKDLITEYIKHKNNVLYQSVMDVVVPANIE